MPHSSTRPAEPTISEISKNTRIALPVVLLILGGVIATTTTLTSLKSNVEVLQSEFNKVSTVAKDLDLLRSSLKEQDYERRAEIRDLKIGYSKMTHALESSQIITPTRMGVWLTLFRTANPEIVVPDLPEGN